MRLKNLLRLFSAASFLFGAWVLFIVIALPDAQRLNGTENRSWLIHNINLLPMTDEQSPVLYDHAVVVEHGVIVDVFPTEQIANHITLKKMRKIDGKGQYLMPGLTDVHVHIFDEAELAANLYYGVTNIRNMSGFPFHLRLEKAIENRQILAPSFITTGPVLNSPGPNHNVLQQIVHTPEDAKASVEAQYHAGFDHIKVYSNLHPEIFEEIKNTASRLGMSLTGHTPEGNRHSGIPVKQPFELSWTSSLGQGFTSLEHIETIAWHALRDSMNTTDMRETARLLFASGEAVTPTLIAHRRLVDIALTQGRYLQQNNSDMVNPMVTLSEQGSIAYWSNMDPTPYELPRTRFFLSATKILHEEGVPLLAGSDSGGFGLIPGKALHQELQLLKQAGLTNYEVLQAATENARIIGFKNLGQIRPGFGANLILLTANPLDDLKHLEDIEGVMLKGQWIDQKQRQSLMQVAKDTRLTRTLIRFAEMKLREWQLL